MVSVNNYVLIWTVPVNNFLLTGTALVNNSLFTVNFFKNIYLGRVGSNSTWFWHYERGFRGTLSKANKLSLWGATGTPQKSGFPSTSRQNSSTFGAALRGTLRGWKNKNLLTGTVPVITCFFTFWERFQGDNRMTYVWK